MDSNNSRRLLDALSGALAVPEVKAKLVQEVGTFAGSVNARCTRGLVFVRSTEGVGRVVRPFLSESRMDVAKALQQ